MKKKLFGSYIVAFDFVEIGGIEAGVLNEINLNAILLAFSMSFDSTSSRISSFVCFARIWMPFAIPYSIASSLLEISSIEGFFVAPKIVSLSFSSDLSRSNKVFLVDSFKSLISAGCVLPGVAAFS